MTATSDHRPTDQFRDHLEREVRRRFRGAERDLTNAEAGRRRWTKAAAIVVVSASIGATVGFASAQIAQNPGRDSLIAMARAEAMLAKTRADLARAQADDVAQRVNMGLLPRPSLDAALADVRDMEARRNRAGLDLEEVSASGLSARDDLAAPLVNNRDYVKLRLELDLIVAGSHLKDAEAQQSNAEARARYLGPGDPSAAAVDVARAKAEMSVLSEKLKLRSEFLDHKTPADELAGRVEAAQLRADEAVGRAQLTEAQSRLALVEKRRSYGLSDDVELLRAQLAVKEQELALQRIALRLRPAK